MVDKKEEKRKRIEQINQRIIRLHTDHPEWHPKRISNEVGQSRTYVSLVIKRWEKQDLEDILQEKETRAMDIEKYLSVYDSISLKLIANKFEIDEDTVEDIILDFIESGKIKGRLALVNGDKTFFKAKKTVSKEQAIEPTPEPIIEPKPQFCGSCGLKLSPNASFCPHCGAEI